MRVHGDGGIRTAGNFGEHSVAVQPRKKKRRAHNDFAKKKEAQWQKQQQQRRRRHRCDLKTTIYDGVVFVCAVVVVGNSIHCCRAISSHINSTAVDAAANIQNKRTAESSPNADGHPFSAAFGARCPSKIVWKCVHIISKLIFYFFVPTH